MVTQAAIRRPGGRTPAGLLHALRTFRVSFWLGWQVHANWTDPFLFFIYSIARPLGSALILVFMFFVVAGGRRGPMMDFFVVGAALWPFVLTCMQGITYGLLEDREHFKTIRYIYTAPIPFSVYLLGRGLAPAVTSFVPMGLTFALGATILGVPIALSADGLAYALLAFALGAVGWLALGMILAGVIFMVSGEAWRLPEAVAQGLYLLCGAVFPVPVLPAWLERVAAAIPVTYWLEAMRRALLPPGAVRSFPALTDAQVMWALALSTALTAAAAWGIYAAGLLRARSKGILDAQTSY